MFSRTSPLESVLSGGKPMSSLRPAERAAQLAATQHGLVTAAQCRELGVTYSTVSRRVIAGGWERAGPGVYRMAGAPRTWQARAHGAVLAAGPHRGGAFPPAGGGGGRGMRGGGGVTRRRGGPRGPRPRFPPPVHDPA